MIKIVLNDEQAKAVESAADAIEIRDPRGRLVGFVSKPLSKESVAVARQRLKSVGPWLTTSQVQSHLHSLKQG